MNRIKHFFIIVNIFIVISFGGFICETIAFYFWYDRIIDRGFLRLPFCPIYGFCVVFIYFILGDLKNGRLKRSVELFNISKILKWLITISMYFILSVFLPTLVELIVGKFFYDCIWNNIMELFRFKE